jgi:hypothetical protein
VSFLDEPTVDAALDRLALEEDVTVFAGAGTSMEVGFPSWGGLLERLLRYVSSEASLDEDATTEFLDAVWRDSMGVLGMGSIVRSQLGNAPDTYIRKALYERGEDRERIETQEPGPSARALVSLIGAWEPGRLEICTTNYDLLLERALELRLEEVAALGGSLFVNDATVSVTGAASGRDEDQVSADGRFTIRHLHGALDKKSGPHDLLPAVLGEADYHGVQKPDSWQSEWIEPRLTSSTWLFVGASMSDANVLRYLQSAREPGRPPHFALLTRGQAAQPHDPQALSLWTKATTARWNDFGVQALYPEYYADVAAFLDELARRRIRRAAGRKPAPSDRLPQRLKRWHGKVTKNQGLLPQGGKAFADRQDEMTEILTELTDQAVHLVRDTPGVADCNFGLQLWIPDAAATKLVMWGSSQHAWRDPSTLAPLPIKQASKWLSVETWCRGTPTLRAFGESHGTRWAGALGVPIILAEEPWGRLPVAVATFNVMGTKADGLLEKIPGEDLAAVVSFLGDALANLLTP